MQVRVNIGDLPHCEHYSLNSVLRSRAGRSHATLPTWGRGALRDSSPSGCERDNSHKGKCKHKEVKRDLFATWGNHSKCASMHTCMVSGLMLAFVFEPTAALALAFAL